ncbi:MAG TPA: M48 family metalloprotease [Xanthobacteraceae bacterium]|nr:M48 family metalloprotease [Xanthobacteraceae bacterium]
MQDSVLAPAAVASRPIKTGRRAPALCALALAGVFAVSSQAARAADLPLIRDAEIEQLLRDYSQPILRAAGLAQQNVHITVVNDKSFNAFVMDGRHIFINTGALMDAKTPNEVIGVLAHETGHLAGGHLARMREQLANASTEYVLATILGIGAAIAASRSSDGAQGASIAALSAPQEIIGRTLLSYQRAQEEQADRAGVKFLTLTHQSPKGMYDVFSRLADEIKFLARRADPYLQNHPMPAERVAALANLAQASPYWNVTDPPALQLRHDLMRAKLVGFLESADFVSRQYPPSDTSLPARYARAISAYRHADLRNAHAQIDALIAAEPNNPYFHELKGQALLEAGKAAAAVAPLRRAAQLAPNPALIQVMLAQALIETNNPQVADEAVKLLRAALAREPEMSSAYTQLAMAYGRKGNLAEADLASAQAAVYRGDMRTAREIATRAKGRFPVGSPGWLKADDIIGTKPGQKPASH